MTTEQHTITIPGLPDGWRAVAYRYPFNKDEYIFAGDEVRFAMTFDFAFKHLIIEKIKPRRIVLEETEEDQPPNESQWLLDHKIGVFNQEKKWRLVEEE